MNGVLGETGVLLAFVGALATIGVLGYGLVTHKPAIVRHGRSYAWVLVAGAVLATFAMERALLTHDFSLAYVAANNSKETPLLFTITGMWSALQGSILLWGLVLALYVGTLVYRTRRRPSEDLPAWAIVVASVVALFFFALMLGPANPFVHVSGPVPADGNGPNPLLQDNPLVAIHPLFLYLGFVGFTIPFAFAIASLITNRLDEDWVTETRRWSLIAWGFLTVGIVLGAWWSYQVLGWGGYWAWDPVENSALLPWLAGTAYLHSSIAQQRRGIMRVWNVSLIVSAFSLTILGTFFTRSGILQSVHSFSDSSLGPGLLGFFFVVVAASLALIAWRGDGLRSRRVLIPSMSRESAFFVNNILFSVFAFVVLLGTTFPLLIEAIKGAQVTVGAPFYDSFIGPLGIAILFFMAIAPLLPWQRTNRALVQKRLMWPTIAAAIAVVVEILAGVHSPGQIFAYPMAAFAGVSALRQAVVHTIYSNRRKDGVIRFLLSRTNGGMLVHIGVVLIAVALISSTSYGQRTTLVLKPGQSVRFDRHTFTYHGVQTVVTPAKTSLQALISVDGSSNYKPEVSQFGDNTEVVGTPAIRPGLIDDVYLTLQLPPKTSNGPATFGIVIQPLVSWIWIAGGLIALGTAVAAFGTRDVSPLETVEEELEAVDEDSNDGPLGEESGPGVPATR